MHGHAVIKRIALTEDAHRHITTARHASGVRLDRTRENAEQARLAITILAHDADAVALVHAERHVLRNQFGRKLKMHAVATEQNGHIETLLAIVFTAIHLSRASTRDRAGRDI